MDKSNWLTITKLRLFRTYLYIRHKIQKKILNMNLEFKILILSTDMTHSFQSWSMIYCLFLKCLVLYVVVSSARLRDLCLWSLFRFFRESKDNNGVQSFLIYPNNNLKCVISVLNITFLNCQIHIQKNFLDFVSYVKVCKKQV